MYLQNEAGHSFFSLPQLNQCLKRGAKRDQLNNLKRALFEHTKAAAAQEQQPLPVAVFVDSEDKCLEIASALCGDGYAAEAFGSSAPEQHQHSAPAPRPALRVVVASGDALAASGARGFGLVINLDLPGNLMQYVHRIGLLRRSGTLGSITTFFEDSNSKVLDIMSFISRCWSAMGDLKTEWGYESACSIAELGGEASWTTIRVRDELAFVRDALLATSQPAVTDGELLRGVASLSGLQTLDLSGWRVLTSLPESVPLPASLERLVLANCQALASLPPSISGLSRLRELDVSGCPALQVLPPLAGMVSLEKLDATGCMSLRQLPEDLGALTGLKTLALGGCTYLASLPGSISGCVSLETLQLYLCSSLCSLPIGVAALRSLQRMDLRGCPAMDRLPEDLLALATMSPCTPKQEWAPMGLSETAWYGGIGR